MHRNLAILHQRQKITSTSTERQKRCQNLAPVPVIISGNSLAFSREIITSAGFYWCCAAGASAPVVVKNQSPIATVFRPFDRDPLGTFFGCWSGCFQCFRAFGTSVDGHRDCKSRDFCECNCEFPPQARNRCDFGHIVEHRRVLQGAPWRGRQLCFTFPSAPDPLFKASKAPFPSLRVATPSRAPRQAPFENKETLRFKDVNFHR